MNPRLGLHLIIIDGYDSSLFASEEAAEERIALFLRVGSGGFFAGDFAVDFGPGGEGGEGAVVDVEVGGDFAAALVGGGGRGEFFGVVRVDGEEGQAALGAPVDRLLEELAFTYGPEDELEVGVVVLHLAQRGHGKGPLTANLRVAVLNNGAVEVYCYDHKGDIESKRPRVI